MKEKLAGSSLITLLVLMVFMPSVNATVEYYWWDTIYYKEGTDIAYPHPDNVYYDIDRFSSWSITGTHLHHNQLDWITSDLIVKAGIGLLTIAGAWIGAKLGGGGLVGAVVGGAIGLALGLVVTVVADKLLLDERGCIWWWISEDFTYWAELSADYLYYLITHGQSLAASTLIVQAFNAYGYFRAGLVTLFDAIEMGAPQPSPACAMKTLTDGDLPEHDGGYFYVPNIPIRLLEFKLLFSDQGGDQTGLDGLPDGTIDMMDIGLLCKSFGTLEGHERWEYMAHVTADRRVDMHDLGFVSRDFGRKGIIYSDDFSGVTVTFNTGEELWPDDGFVVIPEGATSFNVTRYGSPIGAMIAFW